MKLTSPVFDDGGSIPIKYSCDGDNINPPLVISNVLETAQSLALIVDDPDVPKDIKPDGLFVHWVMWNIDPKTTQIEENTVPEGAQQGLNGGGKNAYTGPCPPDREHRYFFKLYALSDKLNLDPAVTSKDDLEAAMKEHVVDQTELMGRYEKQK